MRIGSGGGVAAEGEDIEVLELPIDQALAMIGDGRIVDAKTIMLLQYAALNIFRTGTVERHAHHAHPRLETFDCTDRGFVRPALAGRQSDESGR